MLVAASQRAFAGSGLRTAIFLERQLRAHLIARDRLVFDTRFSPPGELAGRYAHVFVQLAGDFAWQGGTHAGPVAFVLADTEFDRVTPGSPTFRSWGAPGVIVEIRVRASAIGGPIGLAHGPRPLTLATWDHYRAVGDAFVGGATVEALAPQLRALLAALATAGVLAPDVVASVVEDEPERYRRLWAVMRPLYEDYATSASLKQIAVLARLSLRQLGRDLADLTRDFGMFGGGFRDTMRILRLRAAVLALSAPTATPSEVASFVGYGSLDAMGRAFRDAHLPAPSVVQAAVRFT